MSCYLKVGKTFVPISQHSEAIKEMNDKSDCLKIKIIHTKQKKHPQNEKNAKLDRACIKGKRVITLK